MTTEETNEDNLWCEYSDLPSPIAYNEDDTKKKKKPDLVAWDEERGYYSRELTYGSNNSAPAIKLEDIAGWKQIQAHKANKIFTKKYDELKEDFKQLINEVQWNELVYSSKYNFIPIIGETYYLYEKADGNLFLSPIAPNEWNMKFIGATKLDSNNKWI
jgi:hypothetical protein